MKYLFIINPAAGSRDHTEIYQQNIRRVCGGRGLDYQVEVSTGPGECRKIARKAAETGEEYRIFACGGDGTLNEIVSGVAGFSNVAVTHYPGGSGNDFVRIFSHTDSFQDLEKLLDCEEVSFDLIRCNDDYALNVCSVGLDARIGTDVASYKRFPLLHGFRAYAVSTLINVVRGITDHYRVEVAGQVLDGKYTMICVCNGRYYGGGFNPVPDAQPDDGLLDILVVEGVSRLQVAGLVGKYKSGQYRQMPGLVHHFRTDQVKILCDHPTAINLDGELRNSREVKIWVAGEKIRFFYPRGLTYRAALPAETAGV